MLNLENFEDYIKDVILSRGYSYFLSDKIISLNEESENEYEALVEGTEIYTVKVCLDSDDNIEDSSCNCPYDYSKYCKHQASVFYKLREEMGFISSETPYEKLLAEVSSIKSGLKDTRELLLKSSKEQLVDFIIEVSIKNPNIFKLIGLKFDSSNINIESARELIRSYVSEAEDEDGYVPYYATQTAVDGAEIVLDYAREVAENGFEVKAVDLLVLIIHEMVNLFSYCDDSSGIVSCIIDESFDLISEIICYKSLSEEDKYSIFEKLLSESENGIYEDFINFSLAFLEACTKGVLPKGREQLENRFDKARKTIIGNSWGHEYFLERINLLNYKLIERFDGEDSQKAFLRNNLDFSSFREIAINTAIKTKDYEYAIALCLEGEKKHKPDIQKWKELKYHIYEENSQIEKQRDIALELILRGDFNYYMKLRETYNNNDWERVAIMIADLLEAEGDSFGSIYTKVLTYEGMTKKLLDYVKEKPTRITKYYKYFLPEYREDVISLFKTGIEIMAEESKNRSKYKVVCSVIETFESIAGTFYAYRLIQQLILKYKRRPAFVDELTKVTKRLRI